VLGAQADGEQEAGARAKPTARVGPGDVTLTVDSKNPLPPGTANPITLSLGLNGKITSRRLSGHGVTPGPRDLPRTEPDYGPRPWGDYPFWPGCDLGQPTRRPRRVGRER